MKTAATVLLLIGLSFCFSSVESIQSVFDDYDVKDECSSKFNQNWRPDPCTFCSCDNGKPRCFAQKCAVPLCSNYEVPPGQCCPICPNGPDSLRDQPH